MQIEVIYSGGKLRRSGGKYLSISSICSAPHFLPLILNGTTNKIH